MLPFFLIAQAHVPAGIQSNVASHLHDGDAADDPFLDLHDVLRKPRVRD